MITFILLETNSSKLMDPIHVFYVPYMYIPKSCAFPGHERERERERERFEVKFEVTENIEREAKGTSQWQALHIMALFMHRDARMAARTDFSVSDTQAHDFFFLNFNLNINLFML